MDCVILAGGLGTRMRPFTDTIPKALIPVAGRPFVDHQLDWLGAEGVQRVVFCIGYGGAKLRDHIGTGRRFGVEVEFVDDGAELRGTAGALRLALDSGALPDAFMLLYGDSYLPLSPRPVWDCFRASTCPALMTVLRNEGRWDTSNARYEGGRVVHYDKEVPEPSMSFIDYGLSVLSLAAVEQGVPADEVADLGVLFRDLSLAGRLAGYEVSERFYEIGSPVGLADLEAYLADRRVRS